MEICHNLLHCTASLKCQDDFNPFKTNTFNLALILHYTGLILHKCIQTITQQLLTIHTVPLLMHRVVDEKAAYSLSKLIS